MVNCADKVVVVVFNSTLPLDIFSLDDVDDGDGDNDESKTPPAPLPDNDVDSPSPLISKVAVAAADPLVEEG